MTAMEKVGRRLKLRREENHRAHPSMFVCVRVRACVRVCVCVCTPRTQAAWEEKNSLVSTVCACAIIPRKI